MSEYVESIPSHGLVNRSSITETSGRYSLLHLFLGMKTSVALLCAVPIHLSWSQHNRGRGKIGYTHGEVQRVKSEAQL